MSLMESEICFSLDIHDNEHINALQQQCNAAVRSIVSCRTYISPGSFCRILESGWKDREIGRREREVEVEVES